MPCVTEGDPEDLREAQDVPKLLCGVLSAIEASGESVADIFDDIDWGEAGISKAWARDWWKRHKVADRERRAQEVAEKARRADVARVRGKLTARERKLLGIQ